jgi:subtilisin-like proprotein convertase family protein
MKIKLTLLGLLATAGLLSAQTTNTYTVTPTVPLGNIPDGNPVGLMEQFSVSGLSGSIGDISISLDITGGFNGDLYAYLAGPQGQLAVLLNRVGVTGANAFGYSDAGMNITLDTTSANNIHDYGTVFDYSLSGTTWLADGRNVDPQTAGGTLFGTATTANLNLFQTTDPNGIWTLFIADMATGGGMATLNSATLTIIAVPEPQTWAMFGGGLVLLFALRPGKKAQS